MKLWRIFVSLAAMASMGLLSNLAAPPAFAYTSCTWTDMSNLGAVIKQTYAGQPATVTATLRGPDGCVVRANWIMTGGGGQDVQQFEGQVSSSGGITTITGTFVPKALMYQARLETFRIISQIAATEFKLVEAEAPLFNYSYTFTKAIPPAPVPTPTPPVAPAPSSPAATPATPTAIPAPTQAERTLLTPPQFTYAARSGRYTEIHFLLPTKWDTAGVLYRARFTGTGKQFCSWWTDVNRSAGEKDGYCSARTPAKLKNKRVKMYLVADSDLGVVEGDNFWVTFR